MLHNNNYHILKQYLSNYKSEIYGRQLVNKIPLSQKNIALTLEKLEQENILRSKKQGNIRLYRLNQDNTEIKDIVILTERLKKIEFLNKHRKLAHLFKEDNRIIGIFGSYSKNKQKENSDLDLFIIGDKKQFKHQIDIEINIIYYTIKQFTDLLKKDNPLCKEIIQSHIIINNIESFVNLIW